MCSQPPAGRLIMDSVVGEDQTLPLDMNGSSSMSRFAEPTGIGDCAVSSMTECVFPGDKTSPVKPFTMKDYENQITSLKKENFNLKLRIYFMEERMQQKFDDTTEDIYKMNIELKVEVESLKRDVAEKQELLVSASKALESLAGKESAEGQQAKERARREIQQLRDYFNKKIQELEESLKAAEDEAEKMAAVAEQEKMKNMDMEKQLLAFSLSQTLAPAPNTDVQQLLQEKSSVIEQLKLALKDADGELEQLRKASSVWARAEQQPDTQQISTLLSERDGEIQALREEIRHEKVRSESEIQSLIGQLNNVPKLESAEKQLSEEVNAAKCTIQNLHKTLEDFENQNKILSSNLEEKDSELTAERRNLLKSNKTIQGMSLLLKEKDKEIAELGHEIEERDEAVAKSREALHKVQLQKYQGAEEHQNLLMEKQVELEKLQLEQRGKALQAQKLQRALHQREQELEDLQQAKEQLEEDVEELQQLKKKSDKALNDLQNKLKKLSGEMGERENTLEQQYQALLEENKRKLHGHELTIQRLTNSLSDKEHQLQEYVNMLKDQELKRSPGGSDVMLAKLRERLKEKEKALEEAINDKFAAIEEKDSEIQQLKMCMRGKERDLERLNNLLTHNEETINRFDELIKEKDVELQHLTNTIKNLQQAKQELDDNLSRALREKDAIIAQLKQSLDGKSKDMEEMANTLLDQTHSNAKDLAAQLSQRLKVAEARLTAALEDKERLVLDNNSAVEGLLATISSKDQLLKESAEHYNRTLTQRAHEIQELKRQLSDLEQQVSSAERHNTASMQERRLETAELRVLLTEKDTIISKLVESSQDRSRFLAEAPGPQVVELKQTIEVLQERLEKDAELCKKSKDVMIPTRKGTVSVKELADNTDALNRVLRQESQLQMELAILQGSITSLTSQNEALACTLKTKDGIIQALREQMEKASSSSVCDIRVQATELAEGILSPSVPQRERTIIGRDSQHEVLPILTSLLSEHVELNWALKAEQKLYTSLVKAVKEPESSQRLHALQMELSSVQLLRQHLEEGIHTNEALHKELERAIQQSKQRGVVCPTGLVDQNALKSMRHQLEDAQRWNTSLQARLGAMERQAGGVGGANDTSDSVSFIADQTSYMSICVDDKSGEELDRLTVPELHQRIHKLQDCIKQLQALNEELQIRSPASVAPLAKYKHLQEKTTDALQSNDVLHPTLVNQQAASAQPLGDGDHAQVSDDSIGGASLGIKDRYLSSICEMEADGVNKSGTQGEMIEMLELVGPLMKDVGVSTVSQLRDEILRLQNQNSELRGLLKEEKSVESKESADCSGDSDSSRDLRAEVRSCRKIIRLLKQQLKLNSSTGSECSFNPDLIVGMAKEIERLKADNKSLQEKDIKQQESTPKHNQRNLRSAILKSRLPVPIKAHKLITDSKTVVQPISLSESLSKGTFHAEGTQTQLKLLQTDMMENSGSANSPLGSCQDAVQVSELMSQLELLHKECQEKMKMIVQVEERAAQFELALKEKEELSNRYAEALQAAESTVEYLTACSLDVQCGRDRLPDSELQSRCTELQVALLEKENLNKELVDCLRVAESSIVSLSNGEANSLSTDSQGLLHKLAHSLQHISITIDQSSLPMEKMNGEKAAEDWQHQIDQLQKDLWEQNRQNAELRERLRTTHPNVSSSISQDSDFGFPCLGEQQRLQEQGLRHWLGKHGPQQDEMLSTHIQTQDELIRQLSECLRATELAIASLAESSMLSSMSQGPASNTELSKQLKNLQKALQEKARLHTLYLEQSNQQQSQHCDLYHGIARLQKALTQNGQLISELQQALEEQKRQNDEQEKQLRAASLDTTPGRMAEEQLETLQEAFKEKKATCKALEEKLVAAQTLIALQNSNQCAVTSPGKDDKEVQVAFQDTGYETSGKSELEMDREEISSTDPDRVLQQPVSESSFPSFQKQVGGHFSSTENLETNSSLSYPSSPTLSSPKLSLKSLQAYGDYGLTDDPDRLRQQVQELRAHLGAQHKVIQLLQAKHQDSSDQLSITSELGLERASQAASKESAGDSVLQDTLVMKEKISNLSMELQKERSLSQSLEKQLEQRCSRSTSPARVDLLVQSQARELSQLRQQIRESRSLGSLQRQQLEDLSKAVQELLQGGDTGEQCREQLDKSMSVLERLEERWQMGRLDNEDSSSVLELAHSPHSTVYTIMPVQWWHAGEREQLQQDMRYLVKLNQDLAHVTKEQLDLLTKELQEKNHLIQSLQQQLHVQTPLSHHSSDSDISDRICLPNNPLPPQLLGLYEARSAAGTGIPSSADVGAADSCQLAGLQRENKRLLEQLNQTLCSEGDLQPSLQTQHAGDLPTAGTVGSDLLAEHLQEIRSLRQRLEESIHTNERLRQQLERRLANAERDPATNIFIQSPEEQSQLASEVRFLWEQNHTLKEQLGVSCRDKQKENEKLRESVAHKAAKLEQLRCECESLRKENVLLHNRHGQSTEDNARLQDEISRLHSEIGVQEQQLADNRQLLQSLRIELQVHEQMKVNYPLTDSRKAQDAPRCGSTTLDLQELLSEIRHLRLQLEKSIQTNDALRQRLEEQLRASGRHEESPSTININYLLSSQARGFCPTSNQDIQEDSPQPPRLVPGHRLWADRNGRHVLGLLEDYQALRKQVSEGRRLSDSVEKHLQQCVHTQQECGVLDEKLLNGFSSLINALQQALDEAAQLLKLLWRISLPAQGTDPAHQDELLQVEVFSLRSKVEQQEKMLQSAVKRLRCTNQLKEGMERAIIEQLSLTHGVLKRARGNLEAHREQRKEVSSSG